MRVDLSVSWLLIVLLCGCSVKRNNFFSRNYHQLTTRYNVYFNGNQALKSGLKNMENRHKEDYTNLLPVFVSNNDQTRALCASDMDYAAEKAAKAIDKHSITVKPRRRKNKDSKNYQTFRTKKEFNNQLDKCYLLLGKSYFYKKKYAMANNTFRFIQRQYAKDEKVMTETAIWLFRSLTEMGRYDEAAKLMAQLKGAQLSRRQQEMMDASRTDFYVRQERYAEAIPEAEQLILHCCSWRRKPRYQFILSQLYVKTGQEAPAMYALKKAIRFNFDYEMVFNARINMALVDQKGDIPVSRKLKKMLRDSRNEEYRDRIYYALANIEEKQGNEREAIDLYWQSVHASVNNENQQALSFGKLGDYYLKEREYLKAQTCYDSCLFFMDARSGNDDKLRNLLVDLTELATHLQTIQIQDSLIRLAMLPETERNKVIDNRIQEMKDREEEAKEQIRREQAERNFFDRNHRISQGNAVSPSSGGSGDWYFYNPMTIALGKNDFQKKWGRRKLEDNWRRQNKAMVELADQPEEVAEKSGTDSKVKDIKSREYYLKDLPLDEETRQIAAKKMEDAYYAAGELYFYKFDDPEKAMECFDTYIRRFPESNNLPMMYYLAHLAAEKAGNDHQAIRYRQELISRYPENDFAKGIQNPDYFKKVEDITKSVESQYEQAFTLYQQVYYEEAERICEDILRKYPDNRLKTNVLFLKAMCVVNTRSAEEGKEALNEVLSASPGKEMQKIVGNILASIAGGEQAVVYSDREMSEMRLLQANRHWVFDEEIQSGKNYQEETNYRFHQEGEFVVCMITPENFNLMAVTRLKARMTFINASEKAEGKECEMQEEELWYKQNAYVIRKFDHAQEALEYLNRVATDKFLLKIIGEGNYRIFAISGDNLRVLKQRKNIENYISFFTENYFEDRHQGEILTGKWGAAAHIFKYEENINHHFVLAVPFREVNTKKIAESLRQVNPALLMAKENYDHEKELIVVKNVGAKGPALDYMNTVLKDKEVFDRLAGLDYEIFVITPANLKALQENEYMDGYSKFFNDNYLKIAGAIGVEDGDYVYNKSVAHQFVLLYPNTIDADKLKLVFEDFNFAGLKVEHLKFDEEQDGMTVSGFSTKEEAMRYFNTVAGNRKLLKSLKGVDYTNFIITGINLDTLTKKKNVEDYLAFFKKYYLE